MRKVITYGTFDLFHYGHVQLLRRLRDLGDYLVVGISTDAFNESKGKRAFYEFEHRKAILESIRYVDEVIPEHCWEQKVDDIKSHKIATFGIGDDWRGEFDFLEEHCEVVYLQRTPDISSTSIRGSLARLSSIKKDDIQQMFDLLDLLRQDLL